MRRDVTVRDAHGRKECVRCREWLPESDYTTVAKKRDGLASACKRCSVLGAYGLTKKKYAEMLAAQDGACAICLSDKPGGRGFWHIDHDWRCCPGRGCCGRCVRGILCFECNTGLGKFKESVAVMNRALAYLTRELEVRDA